jgi:Mg2+/Co2+ transporter CorC
MKRVMTIVGVLLLTFVVSCRNSETTEQPVSDEGPAKEAISTTAPAVTEKTVDPLDECLALIEAARKVSPTDTKAALEKLDQADQCLHDCMYTANQVYWLQTKSEIDETREIIVERAKP